jgi:precorrin-3B synthase
MTAPEVKGWCPGALRPMESGDGWVVRVRPQAGRLTQSQAAGIAALAARHGNGLIDLSSRANVQLRGVTPETHAPLVHGLRDLGLLDADAGTEARRNIVVTPFWADGDGTTGIAGALAGMLAAPDAPDLPGKFGFALDTGLGRVLAGVSADVFVTRTGPGAYVVHATGTGHGAPCDAGMAPTTAMALARWFIDTGGVTAGRGRMAGHLDRTPLPAAFRAAPLPPAGSPPGPGAMAQGALVALAFGQMRAETLAALAALGPLRVTPWRMLLVEGAALPDLPDLPDLITRADDPLLRVVACTGAPGCTQALGPTRSIARRLAPDVPRGSVLHVSGCAKGCAHPGAADVVLTATTTGYTLARNATAAAPGTFLTTPLPQDIAAHAPHL